MQQHQLQRRLIFCLCLVFFWLCFTGAGEMLKEMPNANTDIVGSDS
uniref:Uncharacterized protein n=1 Tax=Rhizophora mucronata TaxID=61149 RepID=A0A2P2P5N8_RHIMU